MWHLEQEHMHKLSQVCGSMFPTHSMGAKGIFLQPHKDVIQLYKEFGPKDDSGFGLQVLWLQPLAQPNSSALCLVP